MLNATFSNISIISWKRIMCIFEKLPLILLTGKDDMLIRYIEAILFYNFIQGIHIATTDGCGRKVCI